MWRASVSARNGDWLSTTSPIASLTTSSKRDMCAPFWLARQVHEAVQPCEEQLVADAHDLLDARHAHPREAYRNTRLACLDVVAGTHDRRQRGGRPARLHRSQA